MNRVKVYFSSAVSRQPAQTFRHMVESVVGSKAGFVRAVDWTVLWKNRARRGSLLVEIMYLSHPTSDTFLASSSNLDLLADGLRQAVGVVLPQAPVEGQAAPR